MKTLSVILTLLLLIGMASCERGSEHPINQEGVYETIYDVEVDANFKYNNYQSVIINLQVNSSAGALVGVPVRITHARYNYQDNILQAGKTLGNYSTDAQGGIYTSLEVPSYIDSLDIRTDYIGLAPLVRLPIIDGQINASLGYFPDDSKRSQKSAAQTYVSNGFTYLADYNAQGKPKNLINPDDKLDKAFLERVNSSIPEGSKLPESHPQYLAEGAQSDIIILEEAEVFVTFVHEGAGWRNALGYFIYDTDNPPASEEDIDKAIVIFPNVSFAGSGGDLSSGNKVQLQYYDKNTGQFSNIFPPGVSIGWFLAGNGWNGSEVTTGNYVHYSIPELNIENDPTLQQHTVLLYDEETEHLLLGFEDIRRDASSCDQDFNDAVFYASANPITAIETGTLQPVDNAIDSDKDGVSDIFDNYPDDNTKAYAYYYPEEGSYGTLAFEDLWPYQGDYDFNDLVIDYNYKLITNPQNAVTAIEIEYIVKAIGANFHNGFGIELPLAPDAIASVQGMSYTENYIQLNSNNTEAGQSQAVIIVFDNAYSVLPYSGGSGINTSPDETYVEPKGLTINIEFSQPLSQDVIGTPPFNPFLIKNGERGYEIHLPGSAPTDLADKSILGTEDDDSNLSEGRYYVSEGHYPWAMNIPETFEYPMEKSSIVKAYKVFGAWAESDGYNYMDWYQNKNGYRDNSHIYP